MVKFRPVNNKRIELKVQVMCSPLIYIPEYKDSGCFNCKSNIKEGFYQLNSNKKWGNTTTIYRLKKENTGLKLCFSGQFLNMSWALMTITTYFCISWKYLIHCCPLRDLPVLLNNKMVCRRSKKSWKSKSVVQMCHLGWPRRCFMFDAAVWSVEITALENVRLLFDENPTEFQTWCFFWLGENHSHERTNKLV